MEFRELGKCGAKVSAIGVGCWAAGGTFWGGTDDAKTADAFGRALDLGANLFDTAPAYGFGHSERLLAPFLKKHRDRIFLATKFGLVWTEEKVESITNSIAPKSIKAECDASLKRLGADVIDLYQCHWPLPGDAMTRTVSEDMMAALHSLVVRDGRVERIPTTELVVGDLVVLQEGDAVGADCRVVEVPGVGHAPLLVEPSALAALEDFLPKREGK